MFFVIALVFRPSSSSIRRPVLPGTGGPSNRQTCGKYGLQSTTSTFSNPCLKLEGPSRPSPPPPPCHRSLVRKLASPRNESATPNDTPPATGLNVETNMSAWRVEQVRVRKLFPGDGRRSLLTAVTGLENSLCSQAPMMGPSTERLQSEHANATNRCSCPQVGSSSYGSLR